MINLNSKRWRHLCGLLFLLGVVGVQAQTAANSAFPVREKPLKVAVGLGVGYPELWTLDGVLRHKFLVLRGSGGGFWHGAEHWWAAGSFSASWIIVTGKNYFLDLGLSSSYCWFQAPDKMGRALNDSYGVKIMHEYQFKQYLSTGLQIGLKIGGFQVQNRLIFRDYLDNTSFVHSKVGYVWKLPL